MRLRPIYINGRFLTQRITGTQRYAHELLLQLDAMLVDSEREWPEIKVFVPRHSAPLTRYRRLQVITVGRSTGRVWEQGELPFYARGGVLFTPCGGAPILHRRNVVNIHDAAVFATPEGYSPTFRVWYQALYRVLCRTALHIFTVSQFSKAELVKHCGVDPLKVSVTYLGSEHASRPVADPKILEEYGIRPFEYVLTVGCWCPNKNLDGLLRAFPYFTHSGMDLVVAGARNVAVFGEASDFSSSVIDVGFVSDSSLRALYENAACFAFPSFYEGFGLPPLEAMVAGCPPVVSETGSLAEIFGTIAFMCNPRDPRDIAAKILEAADASTEYRERCKQFASVFEWQRCAKATWGLVLDLCAEAEPVRGIGGKARWQALHTP